MATALDMAEITADVTDAAAVNEIALHAELKIKHSWFEF